MIRARTAPDRRICQGDIIKDVNCVDRVFARDGLLEVSQIRFNYVIVLTQDCDLEEDHIFRTEQKETQDKWLISVLVAPLYNAEHVYSGEHLVEMGIKSQPINKTKTPGHFLRQNQMPRYHYLEFPADVPIVPSVIDFKHYFSVPVLYLCELKATKVVCAISELYREDISQRFASFLSRIGLPDLSEAGRREAVT